MYKEILVIIKWCGQNDIISWLLGYFSKNALSFITVSSNYIILKHLYKAPSCGYTCTFQSPVHQVPYGRYYWPCLSSSLKRHFEQFAYYYYYYCTYFLLLSLMLLYFHLFSASPTMLIVVAVRFNPSLQLYRERCSSTLLLLSVQLSPPHVYTLPSC